MRYRDFLTYFSPSSANAHDGDVTCSGCGASYRQNH